jgi:monoterpene epsilon-lactone hydrolase
MTTIVRPLSTKDGQMMAKIRTAAAPAKGVLDRGDFDALMEHTPPALGVTYEAARVGGVPGWWCRPSDAAKGSAILYLHGGAYVAGSAKSYRNFVGQIAMRANAAAFIADYGLAPEHPFPRALKDARAAYRGLAELGYTNVALAGDSGGGGLALILLASAIEEARHGATARPTGAAVMSPWTDLALSGESMETCAEADPFLTRAVLASAASRYLGHHDARDPLASPLYGNLSDLPPVRLDVGEDEILLDDSRRYADRLATAGGEVRLNIWAGMAHVFLSNVGTLDAAISALGDVGAFLRELAVESHTPNAQRQQPMVVQA